MKPEGSGIGGGFDGLTPGGGTGVNGGAPSIDAVPLGLGGHDEFIDGDDPII